MNILEDETTQLKSAFITQVIKTLGENSSRLISKPTGDHPVDDVLDTVSKFTTIAKSINK